jgi:hypothetical protein
MFLVVLTALIEFKVLAQLSEDHFNPKD